MKQQVLTHSILLEGSLLVGSQRIDRHHVGVINRFLSFDLFSRHTWGDWRTTVVTLSCSCHSLSVSTQVCAWVLCLHFGHDFFEAVRLFGLSVGYPTDSFHPIFVPIRVIFFPLIVFFHGHVESLFLSCCLLYTSPSPRDATLSRMPSSA